MADPYFAAKRQQARELLAKLVPERVAYDIEHAVRWSIPNHASDFHHKYASKMRSLLFNLRDARNPRLREAVATGVLAPDRFILLAPEDMYPRVHEEYRKKKQARDVFYSSSVVPNAVAAAKARAWWDAEDYMPPGGPAEESTPEVI